MTEFTAEIREIGDEISALSASNAQELCDYLEEIYHIKPAFTNVIPLLEEQEEEKPVEKTEFDVLLEGFDPTRKIALIKTIREVMGMGLKQSKDFVESAPSIVKEGCTKDQAEKAKSLLEGFGGRVSIK